MNLLRYVLLLIVLLCAIPAGFLLAKVTKEELKQGRKAFMLIIAASLFIAILSIFLPLNLDNRLFLATSMLFAAIIAAVSLKKSHKKPTTRMGNRKKR